jgi:D-inositol-3-phosphate glycosyltransferase
MEIAIVGTAYPYRGGLAAYNERLSGQFIREGHSSVIYTFKLQYPGFLFPGKTQFVKGLPPAGLQINRLINSINPFNWIITGFKIRRTRPDILIFKYWLPFMAPCFGTIARIVKLNRKTKVICIFDNVIPHERRPGDKLFTKYFINSIDGALAMSQSVYADLAIFNKHIPRKLSPHPLFDNFGKSVPHDIAIAKLGLEKGFSYMLFFGFIRSYKGLDLLIKAFADPRLRNKNLKLIIAGEFYEDEEPYRNLIKENKLEKDIVMFDRFINDDEVSLFFSVADLIVQPYKNATQSGVTQIAFHFEKPMLVTDVGGLKEIVPHGICGYAVKPDKEEIAEAIIDYFENNRKPLFTENVIKEKEKYSWRHMSASVLEVYNKCQDDNKK